MSEVSCTTLDEKQYKYRVRYFCSSLIEPLQFGYNSMLNFSVYSRVDFIIMTIILFTLQKLINMTMYDKQLYANVEDLLV